MDIGSVQLVQSNVYTNSQDGMSQSESLKMVEGFQNPAGINFSLQLGEEIRHFIVFILIVGSVLLSPSLIQFWKRKHNSSYQIVNLLVMWLFPLSVAISAGFYRFILTLVAFTGVNVMVFYKASRKPLSPETPRLIYKWFSFVNSVSYVGTILGLVLFLVIFFTPLGISPLLIDIIEGVMLILFYGVYFGILNQDLVTICVEKMSSTIGYYTEAGLPNKTLPKDVCAICGAMVSLDKDHGGLLSSGANENRKVIDESSIFLNCNHQFHYSCIRGWCLVGKRDICPYCHEKVDLKFLLDNLWDRSQTTYLTILDYFRYIIAWQPITLMLTSFLIPFLGLEK